MVVRLPDGSDEAASVRACRARDLSVAPLRAYYAGPPRMAGLVIGFAGTPAALAADLARRLAGALTAVTSPIGLQVLRSPPPEPPSRPPSIAPAMPPTRPTRPARPARPDEPHPSAVGR